MILTIAVIYWLIGCMLSVCVEKPTRDPLVLFFGFWIVTLGWPWVLWKNFRP